MNGGSIYFNKDELTDLAIQNFENRHRSSIDVGGIPAQKDLMKSIFKDMAILMKRK